MKKNSSFLRLVLLFVFAILLHGVAMAQTKKVTGVVKDAAGEPLIGASVLVKGTSVGSMTDFNGAYSIDVPEGATTLVISYIGLATQELPITGELVNVTMISDSKELDEMVVIGYGTVKKRDLTGSVSSIKSRDMQSVSSNNAMEAMQGKIAGLDISKKSGAAGEGLDINLRGNRSLPGGASNAPLILVDGVEYGSTIDLNTSDIESMEVLKDGSSTAIYGTRGANGVIIITTKKGKAGVKGGKNTLVNYNMYVSSNTPTLVPRTMTAKEEVDFLIERKRQFDEAADVSVTDPLPWGASNRANYDHNNVLSGAGLDLYNQGANVNWFDMVLSNTLSNNHELSVLGAGDKTSYNFSLGYMNENGLMRNDNLNRYNVKLGLDHIINKTINLGGSLLYTKRDWNRREDGAFSQIVKMHAIADDSLDIPSPLQTSHTNPLLNQQNNNYLNNTQQNRFFGNAYLNVNILKDLKFKTMFAADITNNFKGIYEDYKITGRNQSGKNSYISQENTDKTNITWDNTLNYALKIKKHDIQALAGQSMIITTEYYGMTSGTAGKEHIENGFSDLKEITAFELTQNANTESRMLSYFGRLNYKYADKYLLTGTLRADGSSVLAEGNKWGYFPSVAGAWRISEEKFLKNNTKLFNNLKLRYSWGVAGNAAVPAYGTLTTLAEFKNYYSFNNVTTFGFIPGNLGNKDLTWEKTGTHDIGLDFSILKDRISGSVDVYYSTTNNLLFLKTLPPSSGYPVSWENVGSTENKGIEVVLTTVNVKTKNFSWSSDWTFAANRDKLTGLSSGATQDLSDIDRALVVGEPVNCFLDYEVDGAFSVNDPDLAAYKTAYHPGQMKIIDQNGDSLITDQDRILYSKSPQFILGWNNHFSYKNFTLSILTFARLGQWIDYDLYHYFNAVGNDATPFLDYWTPENQDARFSRPNEAVPYASAFYKEKASYWKIKDITLAYSLPQKWCTKIGVSNVKVYGSMKNYFTFSTIENYDPEQNGKISNPLMKQIVFGLNLSF